VTKGVLKDVPQAAANDPYGYVVTMASPGLATYTHSLPKFENPERPSVLSVDATPITPSNAAGYLREELPSFPADATHTTLDEAAYETARRSSVDGLGVLKLILITDASARTAV